MRPSAAAGAHPTGGDVPKGKSGATERAANDNRLRGEELIARIMRNHPSLTRENVKLLLAADRP